jgi:hypothetical protein
MDIAASVWNESDTLNNTPAPDGAPEGMFPSGVNDTIRADRGAIKRWYNQTIPLLTGGSPTAYTLSYSVAPGAVLDGMTHLVRFHATNGPFATLNVNGLGAKPLYCYAGSWVQAPIGMVAADQIARVAYNASVGAYFLLGLTYVSRQVLSASAAFDFPGIPTTVNALEIMFDLVMSVNNSSLLMQFYNSGGVLDIGGTDYFYIVNVASTGSPGLISASASSILLGSSISNSALIGITGDITIPNIQGAKAAQCNFRSGWFDQTGGFFTTLSGTAGRQVSGNITGVKIFAVGGTMSGPITLRARVN